MRAAVTAIAVCSSACAAIAPAPGAPGSSTPSPASPRAHDFSERDVDILARDVTLTGTIAIPEGDRRWPAVILIHGSGPLGRDERLPGQLGVQFGFEIPVFAQLSDHLARAGFAVVRYDKRTCTRRHGCDNDYPEVDDLHFDDLLADAQAVIEWMREHPAIDPARVFVIGHSQGGTFAPELLTDNPELPAAVMLAAPYRPIDELSHHQADHVERLLLSANQHPHLIGIRMQQLAEIASRLRKLRAGSFSKPMIADTPVAYWQEWMALGDAMPPLVQALDRPLLALSGDLDTNVPPSETRLWREAFANVSPNPGHVAVLLPCVTHALNCVARDDAGEQYPERFVSPLVVEETLRFLARWNR